MAIAEQDRAKAFELFDQGESTNGVAKQLFKGNWTAAKKLRDEWAAVRGVTVAKPKKPKLVPEVPEESEADAWDVTLQLSTDRMDAIIARFTPQEKADAIRNVLQDRLDQD